MEHSWSPGLPLSSFILHQGFGFMVLYYLVFLVLLYFLSLCFLPTLITCSTLISQSSPVFRHHACSSIFSLCVPYFPFSGCTVVVFKYCLSSVVMYSVYFPFLFKFFISLTVPWFLDCLSFSQCSLFGILFVWTTCNLQQRLHNMHLITLALYG